MLKKYLKKRLQIDSKVDKKLSEILSKQNFQYITETQPNDIFICGYPKSGNTWMQNLIAGVLYGMDTSLMPDKLTQEIVPDVHAKPTFKRFSEITFFKTHDLPKPSMKKVIHLIRDGRDVMASYYAMNKALKLDVTLEEMIVDGKTLFPSKWHEHTKQWLQNPYKADIIILKYESLIVKPEESIKRVLNHFNIDRSDEIISRSVKGNSFKEMQRKEVEFGLYNTDWDKNEKFIRQGKIGSYKNEITPELLEYFENESKEELNKFNYL